MTEFPPDDTPPDGRSVFDGPASQPQPSAGDPTIAVPVAADPTIAQPAAGGVPPSGLPPMGGGPPGGPLGPPPSSNAPWIVAGVLGVLVLILLAVIFLGGDDDTGDVVADGTSTSFGLDDTTSTSEETTTTSAPDTTTTSEATTTTSTTVKATTTTVKATTTTAVTYSTQKCQASRTDDTNPGKASNQFYDAWTVNDRACAEEIGSNAAIDKLFANNGAGNQWTYEGCGEDGTPEANTNCIYRYEGGSALFRLRFVNVEGGWTVFDIEFSAD